MKALTLIARALLGLLFIVFGLNGLFPFLHAPLPGGDAGNFLQVMFRSHYIYLVGAAQALAGFLLIANQFVPLALVILAGMLANILTYHLTLSRDGFGMAIVVAIVWLFLAFRYRRSFAALFARNPPL